jgi:hypothetical protein
MSGIRYVVRLRIWLTVKASSFQSCLLRLFLFLFCENLPVRFVLQYRLAVQLHVARDAQKQSMKRAVADVLICPALFTKIPSHQICYSPNEISAQIARKKGESPECFSGDVKTSLKLCSSSNCKLEKARSPSEERVRLLRSASQQRS